MRFSFIALVVAVTLFASCDASAVDQTKLSKATVPNAANLGLEQRFLRSHKTVDDSEDLDVSAHEEERAGAAGPASAKLIGRWVVNMKPESVKKLLAAKAAGNPAAKALYIDFLAAWLKVHPGGI